MSEEIEQQPQTLEGEFSTLEADRANLENMVGPDAAPEPQPGDEYQPQQVSPEENLAGLLELIFLPADAFGMKRTAAIWTPDQCRLVAEKAVPVLRKYGWGRAVLAWLDGGMGVEEIALLVVLTPLARRTFEAVRADVADLKAKQAEAVAAA